MLHNATFVSLKVVFREGVRVFDTSKNLFFSMGSSATIAATTLSAIPPNNLYMERNKRGEK
jgi:hypothetical protein